MKIDSRLDDVIDCLYRVAVKAVIIRDGKVLLTRDERDTGWTFPGGGIDVGESPEQALARELEEEIGVPKDTVVVENVRLPILIGHIKKEIPRCNIHYAVSLSTDDIKGVGEIVDLKWIAIDELEDQEFDTSAGNKNEFIQIVKLALSKN